MRARVRNHVFTTGFIVVCLLSNPALVSLSIITNVSLVPLSPAAVSNAAMNSLNLMEKASHVLVGRVENIESHWDEATGSINSYVRVYVEERLKGTLQDEYVVIRHRGGEVGDKGLLVSGEPRFLLGERVKVLLKLEETGEFTVLDGWKGKISLTSPASSGFNYSDIHWDKNDLPVPYYINENGSLDVPGTNEEFQAVQASFQTWEDDPESSMDYTYMGTTTLGNQSDGYNVVSWQSIDGVGGALAEANSWYDRSTKLMIEFDIVFDEDETWSAIGEPGKYDIQNVGTHEVGHTLVLNDLYDEADSEQTMYGSCSLGETKKRTLAEGDLAGIRHIYPMPTPVYTIATSPSGLQIEVDGTVYTSPQSFEWAPNTTHTIYAPSTQSGSVNNTRYFFIGWSDGGAQQHQITVGASSVTVIANYVLQYRVSMTFKTYDGVVTLQPTQVQILGGSPNNTLVTLESYSNVWLNNVTWTLKQVLWRNSNVAASVTPSVNLAPNYEWTIICRVYPISFDVAFRNFEGAQLSENPSSFRLQFPNGTISRQLNPSSVYYIQNGTTRWKSITWQDVDVAPSDAYFDATDGNPVVNCLIYDFVVKVSDSLGFPVAGAHVSVELSNGRTVNTQTGSDGVAVIHMAPQGGFTASISYLGQVVTVSGDVDEVASASVKAKMAFGLSVLILLSVLGALAGVLVVFLMLRMARTRRVQMGSF